MAKVKNPFMSLGASGTVGNVITCRMTHRGPEITIKPASKQAPSQQQIIERQRMKDARIGFKTLDNQSLTYWEEWALARSLPVWMAYFQEWQIQQVQAGNQPEIPEPTI